MSWEKKARSFGFVQDIWASIIGQNWFDRPAGEDSLFNVDAMEDGSSDEEVGILNYAFFFSANRALVTLPAVKTEIHRITYLYLFKSFRLMRWEVNRGLDRESKGESERERDSLFVCLLVAERPSNRQVYLRDGSAQTILRAATLR